MPMHNFLDTSAVSLAVALTDASKPEELPQNLALLRVPFRSETYTASKEPQMSQAISGSRRNTNQKNTSGTATGGMTVETGKVSFLTTLIQASLMSEFANVTGSGETEVLKLIDAGKKKYLFTEKREDLGGGNFEYHNYYAQLVGQMTLNFSSNELSTAEFTSTAGYYDQATGDASKSKASSYVEAGDYEIIDSSNNVDAIQLYDPETGTALPLYFSTATLTVNNNVRTQGAVGHEWAPGLGMGKFNVQLTGTVYYENADLQRRHMNNGRVGVRIVLKSSEGTLAFVLPNAAVQPAVANAQGENQDYTMDVTLDALEGDFSLNNVREKAALLVLSGPSNMDVASLVKSKVSVEGVAIDPATVSIKNGGAYDLKAVVTPSNAAVKEVTWSSSNVMVAHIETNGKVRGRGEGEAIITATSVDDPTKKGTCTVTVTP